MQIKRVCGWLIGAGNWRPIESLACVILFASSVVVSSLPIPHCSAVSQHSPPLRPRFHSNSPISRNPRLRRRRWRLPWSTPNTCARSTGRAVTSAPSSPTRDAPRSCSASRTCANRSPPRALVYSLEPPTTVDFFRGPVASDWHGDSWAVGLLPA